MASQKAPATDLLWAYKLHKDNATMNSKINHIEARLNSIPDTNEDSRQVYENEVLRQKVAFMEATNTDMRKSITRLEQHSERQDKIIKSLVENMQRLSQIHGVRQSSMNSDTTSDDPIVVSGNPTLDPLDSQLIEYLEQGDKRLSDYMSNMEEKIRDVDMESSKRVLKLFVAGLKDVEIIKLIRNQLMDSDWTWAMVKEAIKTAYELNKCDPVKIKSKRTRQRRQLVPPEMLDDYVNFRYCQDA